MLSLILCLVLALSQQCSAEKEIESEGKVVHREDLLSQESVKQATALLGESTRLVLLEISSVQRESWLTDTPALVRIVHYKPGCSSA